MDLTPEKSHVYSYDPLARNTQPRRGRTLQAHRFKMYTSKNNYVYNLSEVEMIHVVFSYTCAPSQVNIGIFTVVVNRS
jgi:hypothetical protein